MYGKRISLMAIIGLSLALCTCALAWPGDPTVNVPLCTAGGNQYNARVSSDGAGGAIVAWHDRRTGSNADIYAQRVDASGTVLWTTNGVALSTAPSVPFSSLSAPGLSSEKKLTPSRSRRPYGDGGSFITAW